MQGKYKIILYSVQRIEYMQAVLRTVLRKRKALSSAWFILIARHMQGIYRCFTYQSLKWVVFGSLLPCLHMQIICKKY